MAEAFFPRLCGGTFFSLLTHAMKPHGRSHDTIRGVSGITDAGCFKSLIRVYYPSLPNLAATTESSNASNYKKCENLSQNTFPLSDAVLINNYKQLVINSYDTVLRRMDSLVEEYIDTDAYGEWLVQALLQLIKEDQSISGHARFFIQPDGSARTKNELESTSTFYLQPFLTGVWTYIICNRPDNTIGKETYTLWFPASKNGGRGKHPEFTSSIGNSTGRSVSVTSVKTERVNPAAAAADEPAHRLSEEYSDYLSAARHKYEFVKTIIDEAPKPFYDFYVCNGLEIGDTALQAMDLWNNPKINLFCNPSLPEPTIDQICETGNFIIIQGTGGLGKSMMMRHLMLNTIDRVDFIGKLPVLAMLKDYNRHNLNLVDFVFDQFKILYPEAEKDRFTAGLASGSFVLLLDGLDEIHSEYQEQFDRALSSFVDSNPKNTVIMSSRPMSKFTRFERFIEMKLNPFSKDQALKLIDKLVFRPDEPELKRKFKAALNHRLYDTHQEFAENPLLLTFMLMTFERFGEVPALMHTFYGEVYDLLSKRHDASKIGFTRAYRSGLTPDRLKDIFAAFCANTYADQKYNLSRMEMEEYFRQIVSNSRVESERSIIPADLVQDVTTGVCMMYEEGQKYYFMHRSFQEYFCALAFSKQMDEDLQRIGEFFEQRNANQRSDKAFSMLYDMIPDRVEKYIFIPFLEDLLPENQSSEGYWDFVLKIYPDLYYNTGKIRSYSDKASSSFIVEFLLEKAGLDDYIDINALPFCQDLAVSEFISTEIDGHYEVIETETNSGEVVDEGDEHVGWKLHAAIYDILHHREQYSELMKAMEDESFLYKRQYEYLRHLLAELKEKHRKPKKNLITVI